MRDLAQSGPDPGGETWPLAVLAATVFAIDPHGLGGIALRALPGPVRDAWLSHLSALLPAGTPMRRVPLNADEGRLIGGLDLAATLAAGHRVGQRGLITEADGGVLILPGAERMQRGAAAHLAAALDTGEIRLERDGLAACHAARIGLVLLDEGAAPDERAPDALTDRLAFRADLGAVSIRDLVPPDALAESILAARARLHRIEPGEETIEALTATAAAFGIASVRAPILALRAARALAALAGRNAVGEEEAALAVQLVLAHRATRLPVAEEEAEEAPPPPEPESESAEPPDEDDTAIPPEALQEMLIAATLASLPEGLLERLRAGQPARGGEAGKAGAARVSALRGRPLGARPGDPRSGQRLALIDTLRAAAPWQPLRRRDGTGSRRVEIRRDDFRIARFKERSETTTIFAVDASGSSAIARLAEAKGAVELLLAEAYRRRDQVALISFRGTGAELALPPTRSLLRAKRSLAGLPGGGGTPLATGIDTAAELALALRRRGRTPVVVVLTDGKANVARDGTGGRARAGEEARAAAQRLRAEGVAAIVIDTSPRPRPEAREIAHAMGADYLPLPRADARTLGRAVRALGEG